MGVSKDPIATLVRRLVYDFSTDVEIIQAGVIDTRHPPKARSILATALVYVVEPIDLTPDHLEGVGLIDDAAIIRLAARGAVAEGADDEGLRRLAGEAEDLGVIFGELVVPLQVFFDRMRTSPDRRGRTPDEVMDDPDARMNLWRDVVKRRDGFRDDAATALNMDGAALVKQLRSKVRDRLIKLGIPV